MPGYGRGVPRGVQGVHRVVYTRYIGWYTHQGSLPPTYRVYTTRVTSFLHTRVYTTCYTPWVHTRVYTTCYTPQGTYRVYTTWYTP